jgi:hypothetical protein
LEKDGRPSGELIKFSDRINTLVKKYSREYQPLDPMRNGTNLSKQSTSGGAGGTENRDAAFEDIQSSAFDASHLEKIVEEIKLIEEGLKTLVAARTKKIIEESVPVKKQRPVRYGILRKALKAVGLIGQKMETYTDFETIKKEVPKEPDEVAISEFRSMIDRYIESLRELNNGLSNTVKDVDGIVKNLTDVSDGYTDQIHRDRKGYFGQIQRSRELEKQLEEITSIHERLSPLDDRYPAVEKAMDHMEMALRESQGIEFKYKTSIDMNVNYQAALKRYRKLINDFRERGDLHVHMVEKFADGAGHMKIAVDNVSRICAGVAKVTQSMIMIVESIEGGNKVLGRYASLIGDRVATGSNWDMEYQELKEAEIIYQKNNEERLKQLESNRKEIETLIA